MQKMQLKVYSKLFRRCLVPFLVSVCIKILLFECYHSTDFEVHRNWLAITGTLPPYEWYYDDTSIGTLDYPPLFAWFEYCLAQLCKFLRIREALILSPIPVFSRPILYFQRTTVILSESVLMFGIISWYSTVRPEINNNAKPLVTEPSSPQRLQDKTTRAPSPRKVALGFLSIRQLAWLVFLNPSLLLLDHIHFQYNGMLIGFLMIVFSLYRNGKIVLATVAFAALCYTKHTFLSFSLPLTAYLVFHYILPQSTFAPVTPLHMWCGRLLRLLKLLVPCLVVTLITFYPFLFTHPHRSFTENATQLLSRLFPFGRGLTHAYWAPNFWALYLFGDKLARAVICNPTLYRYGYRIAVPFLSWLRPVFYATGIDMPSWTHDPLICEASSTVEASVTASSDATDMHGKLSIFPEITPSITLVIILLLLFPILWKLCCMEATGFQASAATRRDCVADLKRAAKHKTKGGAGNINKDCQFNTHITTPSTTDIAHCTAAAACGKYPLQVVLPLFSIFASFLFFCFGWHVHEKASLYIVLPLLFLSADPELELILSRLSLASRLSFFRLLLPFFPLSSPPLFVLFTLLWIPCHVSYLPLIFTPVEQPFVIASFAAYIYSMYILLCHKEKKGQFRLLVQTEHTKRGKFIVIGQFSKMFVVIGYFTILGVVTTIQIPGIRHVLFRSLPFLPLLLVSVVVSIAILCGALVVGQMVYSFDSLEQYATD